ncbi:MAG: indolepyruvate oxidoreductase subunit beta [Lachnospiraceae bacterium]|nr:indolepyruvate oxidoreductase subunit beta [Lachnospiraceae bacterium]MEE3460845.1 indolepyruvate oxidoreductase subunit beta [Lachnospiraceae bacterium]
MSKNIILCGVGGQGTILASSLIAGAAMKKGMKVKTAETIGMAQRGGSVFSNIKLGEASSPLIGKGEADIIIGFEPAEALRMLPYLRPDGTVIASTHPVMPVSAMVGQSHYDIEAIILYLKKSVNDLYLLDTDRAMADLKNSKVMNVLLLGAAARTGVLGLEVQDIKQAVLDKVPEKFHELNMKALDYSF